MELLTLAPGSDRIPVELFQILKDDAVESAVLSMQYALNMQYAGSRQKSKSEGSTSLSPEEFLQSSPIFLQSQMFWVFLFLVLDPQAEGA